MEREASPPSATTSTQLVGGRVGRGRRLATLWHLPPLPRGQAVAMREPPLHDHRAHRRCLRRVHRGPRRRRAAAARQGWPPATPRWPSRCRWPCTASHAQASRRRHVSWCSAPGPIGALSVAALRAMGITDITVVEPNESRRKLASRAGRREVDRSGGRSRSSPPGSPSANPPGPRTSSWSARVTVPPSRLPSARCGGVASSSWSAPASTIRPSTSTG